MRIRISDLFYRVGNNRRCIASRGLANNDREPFQNARYQRREKDLEGNAANIAEKGYCEIWRYLSVQRIYLGAMHYLHRAKGHSVV
jgi:hypothetical protein